MVITAQSEGRRIIRLGIATIFTLCLIIFGIWNDRYALLFVAAIFGLVVFSELIFYSRTTLKLTATHLLVDKSVCFNLIKEQKIIDLQVIRSAYYKEKTFDYWGLIVRFAWEILFPSGGSYLLIYKTDGSSEEILFDGGGEDLKLIIEHLPTRTPENI